MKTRKFTGRIAALTLAILLLLTTLVGCAGKKATPTLPFDESKLYENIGQSSLTSADLKKIAEDGDELKTFLNALDALKPSVEVKSRRVGGATYQVPCDVRPARQQTMAIRWLVMFARKRGERTMTERLFGELRDALNGQGGAFKKKEIIKTPVPKQTHKGSFKPVSSASKGSANPQDVMGFYPGERVEHSTFGLGKILEITGDGDNRKARIDFDDFGEKQLLLKYAR